MGLGCWEFRLRKVPKFRLEGKFAVFSIQELALWVCVGFESLASAFVGFDRQQFRS